MKATETKLQRLIEGTNQYLVPLFQRPYTWTSKEWDQLWTDIAELMEGPVVEHFIGPIVTAPARSVPEGVAKYLLIDGQQRITTLFVLLAAMRDHANALGLDTLGPEIDETLLKNRFKSGNDRFKLLPTQMDRKSFTDLVEGQAPAGDDGISKCYRYLLKKVKALDAAGLEQCKNVVVNRLILVSIILDESDNPHVIFESLNSKGRDLTQADLIRNYFLMRVHVNEQERIFNKYWVPIQDRLGDGATEFIRHFLMLRGSWVRKDAVYWCLKGEADQKRSQEQIEEYLANLERFSRYYHNLVNPREAETNTELAVRLHRLNRIEVTTAYPLLLALYDDFAKGKFPLQNFTNVLDMIENFMMRRWVCGAPTYDLNKFFPVMYGNASRDGDLVVGIRKALAAKRYPRDSEFSDRLINSRLYVAGEKATKLKLLLERLEESYEHKEEVPFDNLTVEHIMPQKLTDAWREMLGDTAEDDHENWLHTLGNVTLTAYNPELSNSDFERKKSLLIESHLELNRNINSYATWTRDSIEKRAKSLVARAMLLWPSLGGDQSVLRQDASGVTGTKPVTLNILGTRVRVDSWRAVLSATLEKLVGLEDDLPDFLIETFPRYFRPTPEGLRRALELKPGVFYEVNLSSNTIRDLCVRIVRERGLSEADWKVDVA